MNPKLLATRLLAAREQQGLTQGRLAAKLGISPSALCWYENAKRVPSVQSLCKLCAVLGVSADYLLGLADARPHEVRN